jgi:hypothetical protein
MNMPLGTIKVYLHRARRRLRESMRTRSRDHRSKSRLRMGSGELGRSSTTARHAGRAAVTAHCARCGSARELEMAIRV